VIADAREPDVVRLAPAPLYCTHHDAWRAAKALVAVAVTTTEPERVAVVGAGLAGCLLATLLARRGLTVDVYERRDDPRRAGAERGRSINLAISARGLDALGRVGLDERTLDDALPMHGRTLHSPTGALAFQSYSADGNRAINSISRAGLNHALLDRAEETAGVRLHFGRRLLGVDAETGELTFDGHTARADVVLGADGAYSAVRRSIQHGMDLHQDFLPHGYKELTIPARDGRFALDPGLAAHLAARRVDDDRAAQHRPLVHVHAVLGQGGVRRRSTRPSGCSRRSASATPTPVAADAHAGGGLPGEPGGLAGHRRCAPWVRGRVALVGDAAHAIVPFFGQGANCAFEDCVELDRSLTAAGGDWPAALARYQEQRKAQRRRHRRHGAGELRGDEREGRLAGVPRADEAAPRAGARARRPLRLALRAGVVHDDPVRRDRGPHPTSRTARSARPRPGCSRPSAPGRCC
jgi:kynurenine 3-monooxygenase